MTPPLQIPPVLGITGMPGSGKSTLSHILSHMHGVWVNTDRIGHDILQQPEISTQLVSEFGHSILSNDAIDRGKLASLVFNDQGTAALNAITHPAIRTATQHILSTPTTPGWYYILEVPLLFEAGFDTLCHFTLCLDTSFALRLKRVSQIRQWSEKNLKERDARQNESQKLSCADLTISGNGSLEELKRVGVEIDIAMLYNQSHSENTRVTASDIVQFLQIKFQ